MAVRNIDTTTYASDKPLSSALATYIAEMGEAAWDDCPRGCSASWDLRDPPILFSVPTGNTADLDAAAEPGFDIFLWRAAKGENGFDVTTLTQSYEGDVTYGLHCILLRDLVRTGTLPPALTTWTVTVAEGKTVTTKTISYDLDPGGLYAVIVSARSVLGTPVEVWTTTGAAEVSAVDGWRPPAYYSTAINAYWKEAGATWVAHTLVKAPYLVELVASVSDPHGDGHDDGKGEGPPLPTGRLGVRFDESNDFLAYDSARDMIQVWPPLDPSYFFDDYTTVLGDVAEYVRRTPLSYGELHSVNIRARSSSLASLRAAVAPDAPARAVSARAAFRPALETASVRQQVYAIAPLPEYIRESNRAPSSASGYAWEQRSRVATQLSTSYLEIAQVPVGDPMVYDKGGTTRYKTKYLVDFMGHVVGYGRSPDGLEAALDFELTVSDYDETNPATAVEVSVDRVAVLSRARIDDPGGATAEYWLRGYPVETVGEQLQDFATSDIWCQTAWRDAKPVTVSAVVSDDDATNNANQRRLVTVKVKYRAEGSNFPKTGAYFVLDGLAVTAVPGLGAADGEV